jgi:hypothetical protein
MVPRIALADSRGRRQAGRELYRALAKLGRVVKVQRFVVDPPDGPFTDSMYDEIDRDQYAVVRAIADVEPVDAGRN